MKKLVLRKSAPIQAFLKCAWAFRGEQRRDRFSSSRFHNLAALTDSFLLQAADTKLRPQGVNAGSNIVCRGEAQVAYRATGTLSKHPRPAI